MRGFLWLQKGVIGYRGCFVLDERGGQNGFCTILAVCKGLLHDFGLRLGA